jgi:DNA replication protein DnaC
MSKEIPNLYMNEKGFFGHCVPEKFANVTLESCDKQPQAFIEYARQWALRPESVVLLGKVGRGKTQFAFAMIREMMRKCPKHIWPRYFTSPRLDSMFLEAVKSEGGDGFIIQDLGEQDLLFIDDFGRETKSERVSRQYFELINLRYTKQLPTIISTNLTLEELGRTMNEAIASRFQEWQIIEFGGEDLRTQRKLC